MQKRQAVDEANGRHSLVDLVLGRDRSRRTVASAVANSDVRNLAVSSVDCFTALLPEGDLHMRDVLQVSDQAQHKSYRPVVAFAGSWHGRDAFMVSTHRYPIVSSENQFFGVISLNGKLSVLVRSTSPNCLESARPYILAWVRGWQCLQCQLSSNLSRSGHRRRWRRRALLFHSSENSWRT